MNASVPFSTPAASNNVYFVAADLTDLDTLLAGLPEGAEIHLLDMQEDGLSQILAALEGRLELAAVHLFTHGGDGYLNLGNDLFDSASLTDRTEDLARLGQHLAEGGDLLLYGCNVAASDSGAAFIERLAELTGADVAASTDLTGNAQQGGDWVLEAQTGSIEAVAVEPLNYDQTLGDDGQLPSSLSRSWNGSSYGSWGGYTYQTLFAGSLDTSDPTNTLRAGCYWDRYYLTGVTTGTTIALYMGDSSTVDDFLQIERNGSLLKQDDDAGAGERDYDSFLTWSYQTGDVIRATTFSAGTTGSYKLWLSTGSAPPPVVQPLPGNDPPPAAPTPTAPTFTDGITSLSAYADTGATDTASSLGNRTGTLTASDTTPTGTLTYSGGGAGTYGTLGVASGGGFTYTPNASVINALASGANLSDSFTVTVSDGGLSASKTISVGVTSANDAPTLSGDAILPAILEDTGATNAVNPGRTVSSLFGGLFGDVDNSASLGGIVIVDNTANADTQGSWQYSTDGGANWYAVGSVSTSAGLALAASAKLHFVPFSNYNGTPPGLTPPGLTVHGTDNAFSGTYTSGSTRNTFNTTNDAATSGVSDGTRTLSTSVTAVNDAPNLTLHYTGDAGAPTLTETSGNDSTVTTASGALSGTLTASDVDNLSGLTFGIRGGTGTTTSITKAGFYGTLTLASDTGIWSYAPTNFTAINALAQGASVTETFEFKVTDPDGAANTQNLVITFQGTNDLPVVAATIDNQSFSGSGTWSYQIPAATFTDAEGTGLTYSAQVVDGSGALLDVGAGEGSLPSWLSFVPGTRTFSGNPPADWNDAALNLRVTATDGNSAVISDTFTLTLANTANQPPVVTSPLTWTGLNAPHEVTEVTFTGSLGGTTLIFDGQTVTLGSDATGSAAASDVVSAIQDAGAEATTTYDAAIKSGGGNEHIVVLTAESAGARSDFIDGATVTLAGGSYTVDVITEGVTATPESVWVQFDTPPAGATSLSFDGLTIDLTGITTAESMASAVASAINGDIDATWTALVGTGLDDNTITLTSEATGNLADLTTASFNVTATSNPTLVTVPVPDTDGADAADPSTVVIDVTATQATDNAATFSLTIAGVNSNAPISVNVSGATSGADLASLIQAGLQATDGNATNLSVGWASDVLTVTDTAGRAFSAVSLTDASSTEIDSDPVVTQGTPAVPEVVTVTFAQANGAIQIKFDNQTVTFAADATAETVAAAFAGASFTDWNDVNNGDGTVTLTAKTPGDIANLTAADFVATGTATISLALSVTPTDGIDPATEVVELTFNGNHGGATTTINGVSVTLGTAVSAEDVATAVAGATYPNYADALNGSTVTFTANTPGDQTDLTSGSFTGTYTGTTGTPNVTTQGAGWSYQIPVGTFTDPENDTLTYSAYTINPATDAATLLSDTAALTFTEGTAILSGNGTAPSNTLIEIRVTDAAHPGTYAASQFQLVIYNDTQTASLIAGVVPTSIPFVNGAGSGSAAVPATAFDYLNTSGALTYSATLDGGSSLPDWLHFNTTTGVFSGNPPHGTTSPSVIVTAHATGLSDVSTTPFTLTIASPNDPLVLTSPILDQSVDVGDPVSVSVALPFSDPDGDPDGTSTTTGITYAATATDAAGVSHALSAFGLTLTTDTTNLVISGNPPAGTPYLNIVVTGTETAGGSTVSTGFTLNLADPAATGTGAIGALSANNTGSVTVTGTPTQGQTLTATASDDDGIPVPGSVSYQWQVSADTGATWSDVIGGRGQSSTLTLAQSESLKQVRAQAFYTDAGGAAEAPVSGVRSVADLPDAGTIAVSGALAPESVLSATITDADGLLGVTPTYQWQWSANGSSGWNTVSGATYPTYTLTNDDGGRYFRVLASYTDNMGNVETNVTSADNFGPVILGRVAPVAVNDTNAITEAGGLNNTSGSTAPITGNLRTDGTDDYDANSDITAGITALRTGGVEGVGDPAAETDGGTTLTVNGLYGTLVVTQATGAYRYTLTQDNSAVQALAPGQSLSDVFNYTIIDSTQLLDNGLLTITVNGADDEMTIQGLPERALEFSEDLAAELAATFMMVDPDSAAAAMALRFTASEGTLRATVPPVLASTITLTGSDTGTLTAHATTLSALQTWLSAGGIYYRTAPHRTTTAPPAPPLRSASTAAPTLARRAITSISRPAPCPWIWRRSTMRPSSISAVGQVPATISPPPSVRVARQWQSSPTTLPSPTSTAPRCNQPR